MFQESSISSSHQDFEPILTYRLPATIDFLIELRFKSQSLRQNRVQSYHSIRHDSMSHASKNRPEQALMEIGLVELILRYCKLDRKKSKNLNTEPNLQTV